MSKTKENVQDNIPKSQKIVNIVAIVICVLLIPILIMNCVLIIKDIVNPNEVPSIFGKTPLELKGLSMTHKCWLMLAKCNFELCCKIRNRLGIGL